MARDRLVEQLEKTVGSASFLQDDMRELHKQIAQLDNDRLLNHVALELLSEAVKFTDRLTVILKAVAEDRGHRLGS